MTRIFDRSVAVFVRGLASLATMLEKAEAHALAQGGPPEGLLAAKLSDDMNDLAVQAHWIIEGAKLAVGRLLGDARPPSLEPLRTFPEICRAVEEATRTLGAVDPEALEARWGETITLPFGQTSRTFGNEQFLSEFALPNHYFHLVTAYCILRRQGVPLQKADFLGV